MRRIFIPALLSVLFLACAQDAQKQGSGKDGEKKEAKGEVRKITDANELEELLKDETNRFFLDVREPEEIAELGGSLPGYVNIPIGQLEKRMNEVPKDKTIITA
jgi:hypothetical protein